MSASILQQFSIDPSTAATSTALSITGITAGSTLLAASYLNFATLTSIVGSTFGSFSQTTKAQSSAGPGNQTIYLYSVYNVAGGNDTITLSIGSSQSIRPLAVWEVGEVAVAPNDGSHGQTNVSPGTNADAVTSGNATNSIQPALLFGLCVPIASANAPAAGTGFSARATVWGTTASIGRAESKLIASTTAIAATFTATAGATEHLALMMILDQLSDILQPQIAI